MTLTPVSVPSAASLRAPTALVLYYSVQVLPLTRRFSAGRHELQKEASYAANTTLGVH